MVRILMLVTNDLNPDPRVEREAASLVSQRYDVRIVGISQKDETVFFEPTSNGFCVLKIGLRSRIIERFPLGWVQALIRIVRFSIGCLRKAKTLIEGVSVIHVHDFDTLPIGYLLSRIAKAKLIYDAHESFSEMFAIGVPKIIVNLVDTMETLLSRRADRIIASGELLGKRMEIISNKKVDVIQNTVSEKFGEGVLRQKPKEFVLGYIGGFLDDRNLRELVHAFKMFHKSHSESKLILAGWGPLSEYLQAEAATDSSGIEFRGKIEYAKVPEILSELSMSIVFVGKHIRNNHYATPNKLFESVAMGVPVLVSNFGELKRIVHNSQFGITVDSWDIEALRVRFRDLYKKRNQIESMGAIAKDRFIAELSWERVQRNLHQLYNEVLRS